MKLFINRTVVNGPWGGGNAFVKAMFELAPKLGVYVGSHLNQRYDAVLLMDPRPDETTGIGIEEVRRYKLFQPKTKIIQRVNECDARKQTTGVDQMLAAAGVSNDCTIFVSDWMRDYHQRRQWPCKKTAVIYNGVDKSIFKPGEKLNNGKTNIMISHWSDNPFKGQDVYEWLDKFVGKNSTDFSFTYIGRTQASLPNSTIIAPLFGMALGEEIRKYDVCINGTVCDPAPNSTIEAIASGVPTYAHTRGGGVLELVGNDHVFKDEKELETILLSRNFKQNAWVPDNWETCILSYIEIIKQIVGT